MRMPKFNSLEEVKEFISSAEADKSFGAISFVDPDSKESIQLPFSDFVEKVGIDAAAEFIFKNREAMIGIAMTRDDIENILMKFQDNPDSLTAEEKMVMLMLLDTDNGPVAQKFRTSDELLTIITKAFIDLGEGFNDNYSGLLSILITFLEDMLIVNSDLSVHADNVSTYREIINDVKSQIIIPEGIDEACLLAALLNIIGERYVGKPFSKDMSIDYRKFANRLHLNNEFIFEDVEQDFTPSESDKIIEKLTSDISDFMKGTKKLNIADLAPLTASDKKSQGNIVNLDIRKAMKQDKK